MDVTCEQCGKLTEKTIGHFNRSMKDGRKLFCSKRCFGLSRRKHKTRAQKVAEKREYDMRYRMLNRSMLKEKKAANYQRTKDPIKEAIQRKKNMPRHVEYCRRPEYKEYKSGYDKRRRETNPRARLKLPAWTPSDLVESIELLKTIQKERKREHKRTQ